MGFKRLKITNYWRRIDLLTAEPSWPNSVLYNNLESYDNLEFQVVVRNLEIDERSVNPANIALWSSKTYAITSSHHK